MRVRASLREAGLPGYRLHWKKAPGRPDVCYPGRKVAIFVNGCFWHRCPYCSLPTPKSNVDFWEGKFARNQARDQRNHQQLVDAGWTVLVVWECRLKKGRLEDTMGKVADEVRRAKLRDKGEGQVVEVGVPSAWRLAVARHRLSRGRR
jgi:DNA mismatch endonuclease (patch repair protein)